MPGKSALDDYTRVAYEVEGHLFPDGTVGTFNCGYGVIVSLQGQTMELFPVAVLCKAIERTRMTIVLWEEQKPRMFYKPQDPNDLDGEWDAYEAEFAVLPKPIFAVKDSRITRWYSRQQIDATRKALVMHDAIKGRNKIDWWSIAEHIEENWNG